MNSRKILNSFFAAHLVFFGLVLAGVIPRELVPYETLALLCYFFWAPLDDALIFFVRCIPLFLAIPLTASFDNFNQWRILSLILFARWLFQPAVIAYATAAIKLLFNRPLVFIKKHPLAIAAHLLAFLALLSLWHAPDRIDGLKRLIFFINASFIGIIVWFESRRRELFDRVIKNIVIPVIVVVVVGIIQVTITYFIDIYQFMRIWGEGIQLREFGSQWSYIATHVGNTWFAYFGTQLSLRVFSLFPDSHSFPIFLLLGLPAFFAWTVFKPAAQPTLKKMFTTRGTLNVLWVVLIFLFVILSGTRGFWAAAVAVIVWVFILLFWMRNHRVAPHTRSVFAYVASFLTVFVLLFAVAYPIFASPQFLISKGNALLLENRLKSILDFGETSNSARIAIWKATLVSIEHHPVLGVGIGNFPVVLGESVQLAKAGSSAHNIYLHIAAEMGLIAFFVALWIVWLIIRHIYENYIMAEAVPAQLYWAGTLITIPWILAYLMTDVALFDERALLLFVITLGLIFKKND